VVPFYDEHGIRLSRMLTDRGTEFCGNQSHEEQKIIRAKVGLLELAKQLGNVSQAIQLLL
jgi:hypothetical protein